MYSMMKKVNTYTYMGSWDIFWSAYDDNGPLKFLIISGLVHTRLC